jgi:hypothetical protein
MPVMRRSNSELAAWLAVGLVTLLGGDSARAQYATSIPFKPWTAQYEEFVYPIVPNNLAMPNQGRVIQGGALAGGNMTAPWSFDSGFMGAEFNGATRGTGGRSLYGGRYVPYNAAFRAYDQDFNRLYQPNVEADQKYYEERQSREDLYMRAVAETDPQKRAELLNEWRQASQQGDPNELVARRRTTGTGGSAGAPRAPLSPEEQARRDRIRQSIEVPAVRRRGGANPATTPAGAVGASASPDEVLRRGPVGEGSGPVQSTLATGDRKASLDAILGNAVPPAARRSSRRSGGR